MIKKISLKYFFAVSSYTIVDFPSQTKKTIVHFINKKHAKKALISRKNLRKSSSPNCNVFINENLTAFLGRGFKRSGDLNKIHTRDGTVHISSPEIHRVLNIYHINDLLNLFPCYDFGENYRENDQNDSLQSSY